MKAVRAIGRCAIKLDQAAERCINVLLDLIQTKVYNTHCTIVYIEMHMSIGINIQ